MPDTFIRFSDMKDSHPSPIDGANDLLAIAHKDQTSATGYTSMTTTPNALGAHAVEDQTFVNFQTTAKTVEGAINELAQGGGGGGSSTLVGLTDVDITSPSNNQVLKYNSTTQKWENGAGGGSSGDHITLTQAEYDALVQAGTVDPDAFYFIKDTNGDGQNFQPIIYSLEEREVGVWTDGKPLYEKTFNNITYGSQTTIDVSSLSIDTVVAFGGTSKETSNNNQSTFGYYNNGSDRTQYYYDASNDEIIIAPTSSAHGTVTIRYTKTTDQAGSGTWTPQGVPAVHYSTNEQVVGTWVDGSPVYEKTIYNAGGVTGNFNFPHGITNFSKLLSYEGTVSDSSFAQYDDIWVVPRIASDGNSIGIDKVSTSSIYIINPNAFGTRLIDWYITIRYTKTST